LILRCVECNLLTYEVCVLDLELKLLDARWGFKEGIRGWGWQRALFFVFLENSFVPGLIMARD
jgi:hypothetical protein